MAHSEKIRIVIADDHREFCQSLAKLLSRQPEFEVVGCASDSQEVVRVAIATDADVVLMDINMPPTSGLSATHQLRESSPHIRVLILTMVEDLQTLVAALQAGARGYMLKGADRAEITRAILAACEGDIIFGASMANNMLELLTSRANPAPAVSAPFSELTVRERELLGLMVQGYSNQEIADRLDIAVKTVRNNVSNLLSKLQVPDRATAIQKAKNAGVR